MKYILNSSPVRTSNNFKINDIKLELDMPSKSNFKEFKNNSNIDINYEYNKEMHSNIGLDFKDSTIATINIKSNIDSPVLLECLDDNSICNTIINVNENIKFDLIVKTKCNNCFLNIIINAKKNSEVSLSYINYSDNSFISFENNLDDNTFVTHNIFDLSGNLRLYNYISNDTGYNSKSNLNNIYITKNEELLDMNYYVKHIGEISISNINVSGFLKDNSSKTFRGTIDFISGCKKSIGKEKEEVITFSDEAKSISLPMLLCHEEDVEGSHGVSNGKIDDEILFYIESRGLTKEDAIKLVINAKFKTYIDLVPDTSIKEEIMDFINKSI